MRSNAPVAALDAIARNADVVVIVGIPAEYTPEPRPRGPRCSAAGRTASPSGAPVDDVDVALRGRRHHEILDHDVLRQPDHPCDGFRDIVA